MVPFDPQRVWLNVRKSTTEDLLHRITVFRAGMEPQAVDIIEEELRNRGIYQQQIQEHGDRMAGEVIVRDDGIAAKCSFCHDPAVAEGWNWHRLWGLLPLFPRHFYYCREHRRPEPTEEEAPAEESEERE